MLGVRWDVVTDHIVFSLTDIAQQARGIEPMKRHIVSVVGRFYDPIGFLTPITIQFKVLFQQLCELKIGWDKPLSGEELRR